MEKLIKIFLTISIAAVIAYAGQPVVDTTKKQDSSAQVSKAAVPATTTNPKKTVTEVRPKQPTNWSKVKDLFL